MKPSLVRKENQVMVGFTIENRLKDVITKIHSIGGIM
jgi:hypothetical protein